MAGVLQDCLELLQNTGDTKYPLFFIFRTIVSKTLSISIKFSEMKLLHIHFDYLNNKLAVFKINSFQKIFTGKNSVDDLSMYEEGYGLNYKCL